MIFEVILFDWSRQEE